VKSGEGQAGGEEETGEEGHEKKDREKENHP